MKEKIAKAPWYFEKTGFFGPGYLREYGNYLTKERTAREVEFLEKRLLLKRGNRIFDCPCGHGRHSIELAQRGYLVTGQDISPFFLGMAKKEARRLKVSVHWIKADMRNIQFKEEFDVALCLFSSFGYLESDEEHQKALHQIAKALKRGGKFVLDVINRDRFIRTYREQTRKQLSDGSIILSKHDFHSATGYNMEKRIRIWRNGKQEVVSHFVRMYTLPELILMLRNASLTVKEMHGDFNSNPISLSSSSYIIIAEKF